jgi:hypothetical protein
MKGLLKGLKYRCERFRSVLEKTSNAVIKLMF